MCLMVFMNRTVFDGYGLGRYPDRSHLSGRSACAGRFFFCPEAMRSSLLMRVGRLSGVNVGVHAVALDSLLMESCVGETVKIGKSILVHHCFFAIDFVISPHRPHQSGVSHSFRVLFNGLLDCSVCCRL